jgi:hypothetical protein
MEDTVNVINKLVLYTLLFGNNFISESPQVIKFDNKTLFTLSEDKDGFYLSAEIFDLVGNVIVKVEKNICTHCSKELIIKYNERNYLLINNKQGENIIQSRILDKNTLLVSGIFSFKEFVLIATQNYIILPNGKRMMHNRVSASNGSVIITEEGVIKSDLTTPN